MGKRKHAEESESEDSDSYRPNRFVDVEASEEEDEEEDESLSSFINEIAEEVEEDEEEEEGEEEEGEEEEEIVEKKIRRKDAAEPVEDFEELTRKLEEKYRRTDEQIEVEEVPQQLLLPNDRSPKLWLVRCLPRKEKQVVLAIMRRYLGQAEGDSQVQIFSALCNEGVSGYIYIEAYQKQQVVHAIEGVAGVFKGKISQVPTKEMIEVVTVPEMDPVIFRERNFLRIRKGKYTGDVVQVDSISQKKGMVNVKIVPRILKEEKQKLFSPDDHSAAEVYKLGKDSYIYKKDTYKNGFLIKEVPSSCLSTSPPPTQEEKKWFAPSSSKEAASVAKGEFIEVVSGGLRGASGTVISTANEEATISIDGRNVTVPLTEIRKRYSIGDEVVVFRGRRKGRVGFIVEIEGDLLKISTNGFSEEIEARTDEVRLGSEGAGDAGGDADYAKNSGKKVLRGRRDPLVNKTGSITVGEHKGRKGVVKDVFENTLRIQLVTSLKYVEAPRDGFVVERGYPQMSASGPLLKNARRGDVTPPIRSSGGSGVNEQRTGAGGGTPILEHGAEEGGYKEFE